MTTCAFASGGNVLVPFDNAAASVMRKIKAGEIIRADFKIMRNGRFFRKWWALVKVAYDIWTETKDDTLHNGVVIQPNFDRFRRDVTIQAGHYEVVVNAITNESRLVAKSISWAKMEEDEFEEFYSRTINVILSKVLKPGALDEQTLIEMAERVLGFS